MSGMMAHGTRLSVAESVLPPDTVVIVAVAVVVLVVVVVVAGPSPWRSRHRRTRPRCPSIGGAGRGRVTRAGEGQAELFLTIYLKCTQFSHQGGRYRRPPHRCTLHTRGHAEARGRGAAAKRGREKHYTTRHCETAPPRRNAVLVLSASGQPTARFRRCAALPCVASRRVYVAVCASGAAHAPRRLLRARPAAPTAVNGGTFERRVGYGIRFDPLLRGRLPVCTEMSRARRLADYLVSRVIRSGPERRTPRVYGTKRVLRLRNVNDLSSTVSEEIVILSFQS